MDYISKNLRYIAVLCVSAAIGFSATSAFGFPGVTNTIPKTYISEYSFCGNNDWSGDDRVLSSDLREINLPSSGNLNVDAGQNGSISIKGEERNDVLVRACVQARGKTEQAAKAIVASVRINTSGEIEADGPVGATYWSVSYEILVPRVTNIGLTARNGGITVSNVDGSAEVQTTNGGVNVDGASGSFKGRTVNGGINLTLSGQSWRGSGIDLQTTNGGVNLVIPENFAANIEAGTVNGGIRSNIAALSITTEDIKGTA